MNHPTLSTWMRGRAMAAVACAALALPMLGCGSGSTAPSGANLPPVDDTRGGTMPSAARPAMAPAQAPQQGMSTKKKLVLLAGAAALYYLYRKHQANKQGATTAQNGEPVYYLSKNGRVYYRDANAQAHWVTPPPQGIQVPYQEAQQYQGLQGYDGSTSGETDLSRFQPSGGGY